MHQEKKLFSFRANSVTFDLKLWNFCSFRAATKNEIVNKELFYVAKSTAKMLKVCNFLQWLQSWAHEIVARYTIIAA